MTRRFGTSIPPDQRRPVAWYAPGVLWQAGRELVQSMDFQRNLDRREMLPTDLQPIDFSDRTATEADPFWVDFISDTGDGGNATFTVAQGALAPVLHLANGLSLPEAELLLLGGDLAYPGASAQEYQYRFIEMFSQAQDPGSRYGAGAGQTPKTIAAIPQNHDWFDSASTFCRYFVQHDQGALLEARTPQHQTWFASRLPHGFWVFGLDFALTGDLDRPQFEAFARLLDAGTLGGVVAGDDLVLIYPEPYWTRSLGDGAAAGYPKRYQRLEALIEARGARIRLRLAGDLHHYHRESLDLDPATGLDSHLVVCGSGGAFLHPTHTQGVQTPKRLDRRPEPEPASADLAHRIRVGIPGSGDTLPGDGPCFRSACLWPEAARSRTLAWQNLWSLGRCRFSRPPWQLGLWASLKELWQSNVGFALCLGVLYGFNAYVNSGVFSHSFRPDGFAPMGGMAFGPGALLWLKAMVFSPFATFINAFMLAGCVRIAWEGPGAAGSRLLAGLTHGMAHGFLIYSLYWAACHLVQSDPATLALSAALLPSPLVSTGLSLLSWLLVAALGTVAGGLLFGAYLALACGLFGQLPNNAFGALAHEGYKGFLRLRLTPNGLRIYLLGLDEVPRRRSSLEPCPPGWRVVDSFEIRKPSQV